MIYVTGDIHGDPRRLSKTIFPEQKEMTRNDTVIILGDFGIVWNFIGETRNEKYWLDWLEKKPFTTVFVPGNHENYKRLREFPKKEWNGGIVREIRPTVLMMERGEVFKIEGKKFFAFGGAQSHDIRDGILDMGDPYDVELEKEWRKDYSKLYRILNRSWWPEELPTLTEKNHGIEMLDKNDWTVNFVLTHCCCISTAILMGYRDTDDDLSKYLERIRQNLTYDKWFFGHYHENKSINDKEICLYEQIIRIV